MIWSKLLFKGVIYGIIEGTIIGFSRADTRSLDYSSYDLIVYMPLKKRSIPRL